MDVRLSDEQAMLRDTTRRLVAAHQAAGVEALPAQATGGGPLWQTLADAGLLALRRPEAEGGMGATGVEVALVAEQLAGHLVAVPYWGQGVLAPALLTAAGAGAYATEVAAGTLRGAVQLTGDLTRLAGPEGEGIAFDVAGATHGLSLDDDGALRLHPLVTTSPLASLDLTRGLVRSRLTDGELLGRIGEPERRRVLALALATLAAELVGAMQWALDTTVAYVGQREQFGRPIGSFQALQHLVADAAVLVEGSRSSMWHAAWAVDATTPDRALLAARQAKAYCGDAARQVLEIATQCHGGVAVTWEHPMHVFLRRVLTDDQVLGGARFQHDEIARTRLAPARLDLDGPLDLAAPSTTELTEATDAVVSREGMDFGDSPAEAAFRLRLRRWLDDNAPAEVMGQDAEAEMAATHAWHQALADAGWVGLSFPVDYGGQGLTPLHDAILNDELGAAGVPPAPAINHITNAIRLFGTEEQKRHHLRGMLSCRQRWCQGFSEPNAGSDLAALSTRGELFTAADGTSSYRINGQKIWTSEAVWAQWCLLMLRTEPEASPHRGLSMLVVPMDAPGVEVRPIVTAYGSREFAEVFFDDVVIPADQLLGAPGQGWAIAMALLGFERGPADMGWTARLGRQLSLVEAGVRSGRIPVQPSQREALARAWVDLEALRLHVQRTTSARLDGSAPGPEGSIDKLLMTRADQHLSHVLLDVLGAEAVLDPAALFPGYVWSRAQSIFGGTQQVQRDLVAQRVLGLPRSGS